MGNADGQATDDRRDAALQATAKLGTARTMRLVRLERMGDVGLILVDHPPVNALSQAVRRADRRAGAGGGRYRPARRCDRRRRDAPSSPGRISGSSISAPGPPGHGRGHHAGCACARWTPRPSRWWRRFTAPRWAAGSSWRWHAMPGSSRRTGSSGCPRCGSASIPGAGGTQRLPRLVGPLVALEIDHLRPARAGRRGDGAGAGGRGRHRPRAPPRCPRAARWRPPGSCRASRDRAVPAHDHAAFEAAVAAVRRRARGAVAPVRAAEAVRGRAAAAVRRGHGVRGRDQQGAAHRAAVARAAPPVPRRAAWPRACRPGATPWPLRRRRRGRRRHDGVRHRGRAGRCRAGGDAGRGERRGRRRAAEARVRAVLRPAVRRPGG